MSVKIALLRGVNLGSRQVVMSELRAVCEKAGCEGVRTLLASGNVVLKAKFESEALEKMLERAIEKDLGLKTDVFARSVAEMEGVIDSNPFSRFAKERPNHLQVLFLRKKPSAAEKKAIEAPQEGEETARVVGREIFVTYPQGIGRSKWKLKLKAGPVTARNWNTVTKLAALAAEMEKG
jgi:uncharacterized protein (DUF1697 family)